ncbi:DUF4905 domain-containing protein [Pontibacter harenae]|uniref:DUF4905 domain-containing protein n=1 Tax=Pontibacter harenae TaxID=2894083 RepID=UPI001E52B5F1|nr:DUF4905 domain-containing protein [Pontibacter harenae]MCC9168394.1 DUF4905 domain-containing protein [Pontibacter harenae]
MRLDSVSDRLALEVRDADALLTTFFSFNYATYTLQKLELRQNLLWWQGLEDAHDGLVYLHGYGDRKLGQHKGIITIDAETAAIVWEQQELAFYGIGEAGIYAFPASHPEEGFQLLSAKAGTAAVANIAQPEAMAAVEAFSPSRYKNCMFPVLYLEQDAYFEQVQEFIEQELGDKAVNGMEYAEIEQNIIISYYTADATNKLHNVLAVFSFDGELLLKENIGTSLSGIGSDTFLIFRHDLIFIQDRNILRIHRLLT